MTRFRHTGVIVAPDQSTTIQQTVNQLLHPAKRDASQGSMILLFGGYNTMGQEFGGDEFEVGCETAVDHVNYDAVAHISRMSFSAKVLCLSCVWLSVLYCSSHVLERWDLSNVSALPRPPIHPPPTPSRSPRNTHQQVVQKSLLPCFVCVHTPSCQS